MKPILTMAADEENPPSLVAARAGIRVRGEGGRVAFELLSPGYRHWLMR